MLVSNQTTTANKARLNEFRQVVRAQFHRKFRRDLEAILPFLPKGGMYFDVGANHGRFALELSRMHGGDCTVHSFEPLRYNNRVLRLSIGRQANVIHHEFGLSDVADRVNFFVPLYPDGSFRHGNCFIGTPEDVPRLQSEPESYFHQSIVTRTLDEIVREWTPERLDFVKIDVEGHEGSVLRGAAETLTEHKPSLLVEICPSSSADDIRTTLGLLADAGYHLYDLDLRDAGAWTTDIAELHNTIVNAPKAHDVLCWHPNGPVAAPTPPPFGCNLQQTRFGH